MRASTDAPGRPRQQLRAEADAEERRLALERVLEEAELAAQPRMALLLSGCIAPPKTRIASAPGGASPPCDTGHTSELVAGLANRVAEDAGADIRAMRERKHLHRSIVCRSRTSS